MEVKQGIFYGVGVGPGDPELLTVKAINVLGACPVLACPQTKSGEMLALDIVRGAMDVSGKEILPLRFTMSRDKAVQQAAHREAAEAVCRFLAAGKDVAMPNLGDVSIYSTYCYLMELVKARGFETRMVPGVPSFCAVAARLGISLTEMNAPLHIVPGSWDLPQALEWPGNKILMKSGSQMPQVLEAISRQGSLGRSAMVQNCGLPGERAYPTLEGVDPQAPAGYFATVIVKEGEG